MMLPLLPEELATPAVVDLIDRAWADAVPRRQRTFRPLVATVLSTYVGTPPTPDAPARTPRFPPHLWSVSAMSVRTNNAAESVHAQLNPKVSGRLSVANFVAIIEEAMKAANDRVAAGCQSESRAVGRRKRWKDMKLQGHWIAGTWDRIYFYRPMVLLFIFAGFILATAPLFASSRVLELRFPSHVLKTFDHKQSFITHRLLLLRPSTRRLDPNEFSLVNCDFQLFRSRLRGIEN